MLVFIDESGCPGFKITKGSDPIFAIGMVIFANSRDAQQTTAEIEGLHRKLQHTREFKFSKCNDRVRDGFCTAVASLPFSIRAIMVRKEDIYSLHLRGQVDAFYSYFVKQLLAHDGGALEGAKIRIDGSGDREFRRALGVYLRRELGNKLRDVKMTDSKRDALTQLADMCIGAIARSARDRKDGRRWLNMLRPRIENIWQFR
jgi:hypothetical protein